MTSDEIRKLISEDKPHSLLQLLGDNADAIADLMDNAEQAVRSWNNNGFDQLDIDYLEQSLAKLKGGER